MNTNRIKKAKLVRTNSSRIEEEEKTSFRPPFSTHHEVRGDEVQQRTLVDDDSTNTTASTIREDRIAMLSTKEQKEERTSTTATTASTK